MPNLHYRSSFLFCSFSVLDIETIYVICIVEAKTNRSTVHKGDMLLQYMYWSCQ